MPIQNYSGKTFVAFIDISGFKELMKEKNKALKALSRFYQIGYDVLEDRTRNVDGLFVSDSGVIFARNDTNHEKLENILTVIKLINKRMLSYDYMLTTSVAYGEFNYHGKLEFNGIEKNPIYGFAYLQAFLDNESGTPRIQPGECRILRKELPDDIVIENIPFLKEKSLKHFYYYWNIENENEIEIFERKYRDSYNLKYSGILKALKKEW